MIQAVVSARRLTPIGPAHESASLYAQMEAFLAWLAEKNYSAHTVASWRTSLHMLIEWCDERGLRYPQEVTRPVLERYQRHLYLYRQKNGKPLSVRTQRSRMVPVVSWFRWLVRSHRILTNPASDLDMPLQEKRLPPYSLSVAEVGRILNLPDAATAVGVRDRAILETLYSTGMRRQEVRTLRLPDVDYDRGTVMIRQGKGRKDRMVPIGERALAWLSRYVEEVRPQWAPAWDEGTVFLTREGQAFKDESLSVLVGGYVRRAELGKKGSCHLLRHAMATQMLENGADIRYIQAILGHSSLTTTEIYTQVSIRALKAVHTATHPARLERAAHDLDGGDEHDAGAA